MRSSKLIHTEHGRLRIDRTNGELLFRLRGWRKGIHRLDLADQELYAICFRDKLGEEWGLQFHFGYTEDQESARKMFMYNRLLLPEAIATYVSYGYDGILLPCAYLTISQSGYCHTGYVLFGRCMSRSPSVLDSKPIIGYEQLFGTGATNMLFGFINASGIAWSSTGKPKRTIAELCVERPSYLGSIALDFLIAGSDVVCLHERIEDHNYPFYELAAKAGIRRFYHLPSVAAAYHTESSGS